MSLRIILVKKVSPGSVSNPMWTHFHISLKSQSPRLEKYCDRFSVTEKWGVSYNPALDGDHENDGQGCQLYHLQKS